MEEKKGREGGGGCKVDYKVKSELCFFCNICFYFFFRFTDEILINKVEYFNCESILS